MKKFSDFLIKAGFITMAVSAVLMLATMIVVTFYLVALNIPFSEIMGTATKAYIFSLIVFVTGVAGVFIGLMLEPAPATR